MNQVVIKVIGNYSYQTSRCLGQGVYGKVYEGVQKQTKEKVAIKKIDLATFTNDKYLENAIFSEIYLLKRFNHPNIVKFKDVLSSKNSLYIITEFCKNGDLKEVLKKKKFKEEEAFDVIKQILDGFRELVRQRIIHRDLKPANILINEGVYKIGDFGFAKYVDNFGSQMLKSCVGSPIYMAPQILERTPYTTKCDIWSIGVIFYEMIHNCPPWRAKDEAELLRGIKNVSISHILRKSQLSQKATQFLKRTLAYSEEQRIGWTELFETYGNYKYDKYQKPNQSAQKVKASTREKQRVISANSNSNSNLATQQYGGTQNKVLSLTPPLTPVQGSSNSNSLGIINSPSISPQRKRNHFPLTSQGSHIQTTSTSNSNNRAQSAEQKRPNQIQNVMKWHQFLLFYHYNCVELFVNYQTIAYYNPTKPEAYCKLLLSLSQLIKNRNTFCLSMIAIHSKTHKNAEELYKAMKLQHQSYEMTYNDIVVHLQKLGLYKQLKSQLASSVGHSEVINQDRMQKMEAYVLQCAQQNARNIGQYLKSREKEKKNSMYITNGLNNVVQIFDNILDILNYAINRQKYNKDMEQILQQANNQNININVNTVGSYNHISYDYSSPLIKRPLLLDRERKRSEEDMNQWGDSINKDSYNKGVIGKYERMLSMIDNNQYTTTGGTGNYNGSMNIGGIGGYSGEIRIGSLGNVNI